MLFQLSFLSKLLYYFSFDLLFLFIVKYSRIIIFFYTISLSFFPIDYRYSCCAIFTGRSLKHSIILPFNSTKNVSYLFPPFSHPTNPQATTTPARRDTTSPRIPEPIAGESSRHNIYICIACNSRLKIKCTGSRVRKKNNNEGDSLNPLNTGSVHEAAFCTRFSIKKSGFEKLVAAFS